MSNFSNQLQGQKLLEGEKVTQQITLGIYFGHYRAGNTWYFNDVLADVRDAPRIVDLEVLDRAGNVVRSVTDNRFRQSLPRFVNATGNTTFLTRPVLPRRWTFGVKHSF